MDPDMRFLDVSSNLLRKGLDSMEKTFTSQREEQS
ncbi:unnamed protein product [Brassica napus]|uniref:(rape) hypothetical protein n=1 Tax=Brassica napus TaxID=3708 RepID=A0A817ATU4_BRANA|nr:unnamed protein product [Brassica napus]